MKNKYFLITQQTYFLNISLAHFAMAEGSNVKLERTKFGALIFSTLRSPPIDKEMFMVINAGDIFCQYLRILPALCRLM